MSLAGIRTDCSTNTVPVGAQRSRRRPNCVVVNYKLEREREVPLIAPSGVLSKQVQTGRFLAATTADRLFYTHCEALSDAVDYFGCGTSSAIVTKRDSVLLLQSVAAAAAAPLDENNSTNSRHHEQSERVGA